MARPAADPVALSLPVDPAALRIVLFGMPDAGKSSLLGALAQAAQVQERLLQGRLFDTTSGLGELQRRVYDEKPRETLQEIVPYPVRFEPFKGNKPDPTQRIDAVLYDCDGRAANEILTQGKSLDDPRAGQLVDAVRRADALILVVDASATDEQIESDFGEFVRFLRHLELNRTRRSEIGGLPVFLVLSKCDLLAQQSESAGAWNERLDARRQQLEKRFNEFLDTEDEGPMGFGSLAVEAITTAVRRPAFQGAAAARDPFNVAELFRRAFHAARDFRQRAASSRRRTIGLAAAAGAFLLAILGGAATLLATRGDYQNVALAEKVKEYSEREEATPSGRLSEPLLRKIDELSLIEKDANFSKLSDEQRGYVVSRLNELTAYEQFKSQFDRESPPPALRTFDELDEMEQRLEQALAPPAQYREEWAQTEAEALRAKRIEDIKAIRRAANEVAGRYSGFKENGIELEQFKGRDSTPIPWSEWHDRLRELQSKASASPHSESEPLPGSRALPGLKAPAVTYAAVAAFRSIEAARREWESTRMRLERLRDMSLALGLAGDRSPEIAVLKLPDQFGVADARTRLNSLKQAYPRFAEWSFQELAATPAADIRVAAKASYERLIGAGKQVVLRELKQAAPGNRETHERWKSVARRLPEAPELNEWRELAKVLLKLAGEVPTDPAMVLSDFVLKPSFALRFNEIRVTIPDDAHDSRLRPVGRLAIVHSSGTTSSTLRFLKQDQETRDARLRATTFTFLQEGDGGLTYLPEDGMYAELTVRDATTPGREWKLSWLQSRSEVYRFEILRLVPRFYPAAETDAAKGVLKDIALSFTPDAGVPRVPDLMPIVILGR